jgi:hypothetical protein
MEKDLCKCRKDDLGESELGTILNMFDFNSKLINQMEKSKVLICRLNNTSEKIFEVKTQPI